VDGVSPAEHFFKYNVWMAMIDLNEVKEGSAFSNYPFVSVEASNLFSWRRCDYFDAESGLHLDESIRKLVAEQTGQKLDEKGSVLLLTNLRCFGFVFNPVSVYYCLNEGGSQLQAVVLEVSNTPWLQKRMYVLPFFDHDGSSEFYQSKWRKDFHVSPFFDVFYNYDWTLNFPGDRISLRAVSTRRVESEPEEIGQRKGEDWQQQLGTAPTKHLPLDHQDGPKTFVAGLNLSRTSSWRVILKQPLLTFSIVLYIHVHAFIVMVRKGCEQKRTPDNAPGLGLLDALRHIFIFTVASLVELVRFPFKN